MDQIAKTINNIIVDTYGGILIIWFPISYFFIRFLRWCGEKIAQGANSDLVDKLMPSIQKEVNEKLTQLEKKIEDTFGKDIIEIKAALKIYQSRKHFLEGENQCLKEVVKDGDEELLRDLQSLLRKKDERK
tara:strand:+ start:29664 stop:30056 length:393 start_codon:yes stop_codon:yes gene_type:complete